MSAWNNVFKIAIICAALAVFLFVAVGPASNEFRLLVAIILDFLTHVAWPVAAVVIVFILRKPLTELARREAGKMVDGTVSSKPSNDEGHAQRAQD
jgi:hypothetical protein